MLRFLVVCFTILIYFTSSATKLSPNAQISLVTIGPGNEVYSAFGHNAIRVNDPENRLDLSFDYGTFSFGDNPVLFIADFCKGNLNYYLNVSNSTRMMRYYQRVNRSVTEAVLNLDSLQKQDLYDRLTENALPENKYYQYDFLKDNCATRVRDMLANTYQNQALVDSSYHTDYTYRALVDSYASAANLWMDFGIDLALGVPLEEDANYWAASFLPDFLLQQTIHTDMKSGNAGIPAVAKINYIYKAKEESGSLQFWENPTTVFWVLFILILLASFKYKVARFWRYFDVFWMFVFGLGGCILFYLSFLSAHTTTYPNWNIVLLNPIYLIFAVLLLTSKGKWLSFYKKWTIICLVGLIIGSFFQTLHPAIWPLCFIPLVRSFYIRRYAN